MLIWVGHDGLEQPHLTQAVPVRVLQLEITSFKRIAIDHRVIAGAPYIRGTRIPVATAVALVAEGITSEQNFAGLPAVSEGRHRRVTALGGRCCQSRYVAPLESAQIPRPMGLPSAEGGS